MKKIVGIVLAAMGLVVASSGLILKARGYMSVSVIGGADGPTSIFVAGKVGAGSAVTGFIAGIVLLAIGIFILIRKK